MLDIESIKNINPKDISMLFCDTEIMQDLLKKYNVYIEIETYPDFFSKFYNRNIIKLKPIELLDSIKFPFPYFIKPIENNKTFDGTLIESEIVRNYIFTQIPDHNNLIYYCNKIKFVNEYRMFVDNYKISGIVDATEFLINDKIKHSVPPPEDIINDILKENKYPYCVIDIGIDSNNKWYLIEVNPPFSLMSYDFPIDKYIKFCTNAWNYYLDKIA